METIQNNDKSKNYFNDGVKKQDQFNYKKAIKLYSKAIEIDNKNALIYFHRGKCRLKIKYSSINEKENRTEYVDKLSRGAINDFSISIKLGHKTSEIYKLLAIENGSIQDLSKSIILDEDKVSKVDSFHRRSIYKAIKKDFKGSIEDLNLAIEFDQKDWRKYYNRATILLQDHFYQSGNPKGCFFDLNKKSHKDLTNSIISDYEKSISLNKKCAIAFNNLGVCYYYIEKKIDAIKNFSSAIKLHSTFQKTIANRMICYTEIQNFEDAIFDCNKLNTIYKKNDYYDDINLYDLINKIKSELLKCKDSIPIDDEKIKKLVDYMIRYGNVKMLYEHYLYPPTSNVI